VKNFLAKVDSARTALALVVAIFLAGAGAAFDYYALRNDVQDLKKDKASRIYWLLKNKVAENKATIDQITIWCEAAHFLEYDCKLENVVPSTSIIKPAFAGSTVLALSSNDRRWWLEHNKRYKDWYRYDRFKRPFRFSRDPKKDRYLKRKFCLVGRDVANYYTQRIKRFVPFPYAAQCHTWRRMGSLRAPKKKYYRYRPRYPPRKW